jgi:hypothetical protein
VTFAVVLPAATYRTPQSSVHFFTRLARELSAQSGVQGVAAMTGLPPVRLVNANDTDFEGYTAPRALRLWRLPPVTSRQTGRPAWIPWWC